MADTTKLAGAAAVCAGACALATLPVLLAGGGLAAVTGSGWWLETLGLVALVAAGALLLWRRRTARRGAATCGCADAGVADPGRPAQCSLPGR